MLCVFVFAGTLIPQFFECIFVAGSVILITTVFLFHCRIEFLRSIRDFFQVMFKLEPHKREDTDELKLGDDKILLTCMGVGFSNLNKVLL